MVEYAMTLARALRSTASFIETTAQALNMLEHRLSIVRNLMVHYMHLIVFTGFVSAETAQISIC
jgi:hypothetical protein